MGKGSNVDADLSIYIIMEQSFVKHIKATKEDIKEG
jgi:hypothetical protein